MGIRGQHKNKRDANEKDVFATLEDYGFLVYPLDTPADAICGYRGANYLVEVKNGPKAPLTPPQEAFRAKWTGQYVVLRSVEDAEEWAKKVRDTWQSIGDISAKMIEGVIYSG